METSQGFTWRTAGTWIPGTIIGFVSCVGLVLLEGFLLPISENADIHHPGVMLRVYTAPFIPFLVMGLVCLAVVRATRFKLFGYGLMLGTLAYLVVSAIGIWLSFF